MHADHAAAFHRRRRVAVVMEAALELVRGARERGIDVALADGEGADQVGGEFVVDHRCARAQRRFRVDHRRQRIEIEADQLGGVLGGVAALRQDHGDRLADVADLVVGEQRLLRIDELVLDLRGPLARQRELRVRHRRQELGEVGAAEHIGDAGRRGSAGQIDRADARVGDRAAHEGRVQHARQREIGDELPATGQQAMILAARDRTADEGGLAGIVHAWGVVRVGWGRFSISAAPSPAFLAHALGVEWLLPRGSGWWAREDYVHQAISNRYSG